jgi:hypothetical protein
MIGIDISSKFWLRPSTSFMVGFSCSEKKIINKTGLIRFYDCGKSTKKQQSQENKTSFQKNYDAKPIFAIHSGYMV